VDASKDRTFPISLGNGEEEFEPLRVEEEISAQSMFCQGQLCIEEGQGSTDSAIPILSIDRRLVEGN